MFRIPRSISDALHAAPYTGVFVVSLLEALLTSARRRAGEWGITFLAASAEYDRVQFLMHDNDLGVSYRVTIQAVDFH